jgi:hypothetical protein
MSTCEICGIVGSVSQSHNGVKIFFTRLALLSIVNGPFAIKEIAYFWGAVAQ